MVPLILFFIYLASAAISQRTGDIVLNDRNLPKIEFSWSLETDTITDAQVHDVLGRTFGTPRSTLVPEIPINLDLFTRPKNLALFSIEGTTGSFSDDFKIFGKTKILDLVPSFEPFNPATVLATALTGVGPVVHGVTNTRYPTDAHKPSYFTGNFFDAIAELRTDDKIIAGSSSLDAANVIAPSSTHSNVNVFHWDAVNKKFSGAVAKYTFGVNDFNVLLEKLSKVIGKKVVVVGSNVFVYLDEENPTNYDLLDEDDESFIAELLFVVNAIEVDPAFFAFHFESPKNIKVKYGDSSAEYETAMVLIDTVVSTFVKSSKSNLGYAFVYFPAGYASKSLLSTIEELVKEHIHVPQGMMPSVAFRSYIPHIFLSSQTQSTNLCDQLQTLLSSQKTIQVVCSSTSQKRSIFQSVGNDSAPAPSNEPSPSPPPSPPSPNASQADVTLMHIILWTVVALIIGLVYSCLLLAVIDGSNEPSFKPRSFGTGRRGQTQKVQ